MPHAGKSVTKKPCNSACIVVLQYAGSNPAVPSRWTFLLFIHHLTKRNKERSSQHVRSGTDMTTAASVKFQQVRVNARDSNDITADCELFSRRSKKITAELLGA